MPLQGKLRNALSTAGFSRDWFLIPLAAIIGVAGAMLGLLAIQFPHIIGVGYETTTNALTGELALWTAIGFAAKGWRALVMREKDYYDNDVD